MTNKTLPPIDDELRGERKRLDLKSIRLKVVQMTRPLRRILADSGMNGARQPAYNAHSSLHQRRLSSVLLWRPFVSRSRSTWITS